MLNISLAFPPNSPPLILVFYETYGDLFSQVSGKVYRPKWTQRGSNLGKGGGK
ncbi:MAG: hypothetical protein MRECE_35c026 [Mycoplasmataceae bacterium CE_OT135]|nr:MAG: hypothetical protein MRECE_39c012 [Mycoplasmataceae bacterium CE_OT135]KLL02967.1 MAG: hypothetical protein MRECE_35c026 [Mycoplasmataceae bacterium CE_OT135]